MPLINYPSQVITKGDPAPTNPLRNYGSKLFSTDNIVLGVAWTQGGRDYMQDSYAVSLDRRVNDKRLDFFGVFDGHGPFGENISNFVANNICALALHQFKKYDIPFEECLESACLSVDEKILETEEFKDEGEIEGGCTGCSVWIMDDIIYNCNVGDSRFILSYKGNAVAISDDHKAEDPGEQKRIEANGGFVEDRRVNGILAISRTFGDGYLKRIPGGPHKQLGCAIPDIRTVKYDTNIDFLVVASDGVFDMLENQEVVDLVFEEMEKLTPLPQIAHEVVANSMFPCDPETGIGPDNTTCIVALLRNHLCSPVETSNEACNASPSSHCYLSTLL